MGAEGRSFNRGQENAGRVAMKWIVLTLGVIGLLLGGLWFVQGLGIVEIQPIFCVGNCAPLEGPSLTWAVVGFLVAAAGAALIFYSVKRTSVSSRSAG
jgi:hypothetical protein